MALKIGCGIRRLSRFACLCAVLMAAALTAASLHAPAAGAYSFPPPQSLSASGGVGPEVAVDSKGRATVAWSLFDGLSATLRVAQISATGMPDAAHSLVSRIAEPQLAVGPGGHATIAAVQYPSPANGSSKVVVVHLSDDGDTATVRTVFSKAEWYATEPHVVVDFQGRATVVWSSQHIGESRVELVRLPAFGSPGPVQTLSDVDRIASEPRVAVDSLGRATVTWTEGGESGGSQVRAVRIAADGVPEGTETLSQEGDVAFMSSVAVDSNDRAVAAWRAGPADDVRIEAVRLGLDGGPGSVNTLSGPLGILPHPEVATDSQGRAWIVWSRQEGGPEEFRWSVQAVRVDADGTVGQVLTLSGPDSSDPDISIDSQDSAWIVWREVDSSGKGRVKVVAVGADESLGRVHSTSTAGTNAYGPRVATDSHDRPTVVWNDANRVFATRATFVVPTTRIDSHDLHWPSITFTFSSPDEVDGFECRLDDDAFVPCESPKTYTPELGVNHVFEVRAVNEDGVDPAPPGIQFWFNTQSGWPEALARRAPADMPERRSGIARAAGVVVLRNGKARLRLRCIGGAGCEGRAKLIARIGPRKARRAKRGRVRVLVGVAPFELSRGERASARLALTRRGRRLLRRFGGSLRVRLNGPGVRRRTLLLRRARSGRGARHRR